MKRTVPREDMQGRGVTKTKKIFVGGIPLSLSEGTLNITCYFQSIEANHNLCHDM